MEHKCQLLHDSISHLPKSFPDASLSVRFKLWLKELFLVDPTHPEVLKYLKSKASIERESRRQVELQDFIIHPLSKFRKVWDIFIFFVLLAHEINTPFAVGFYLELVNQPAMRMLINADCFVCAILFLEILICFRTGFIIKETNEIVLDKRSIAIKCYRELFLNILCNIVPYVLLADWIITKQGVTINCEGVIYMTCLFLFSFYRFHRILFYFSSVPILLKLDTKGTMMIMLFIRSIYSWHWASCVRRLVPLYLNDPEYRNHFEDHSRKALELPLFALQEERDLESIENILLEDLAETLKNYTLLNKYTRTMMVTLKIVLQSGFGQETSDSTFNMLMTTFLMIAGWIYCAYVLILVSNVMMASDNSVNRFEQMSREIDAFCDAKGLSENLSARVKTFYKYKFKRHYFNENAIERSTPANLRKEIMMISCSSLVAKVSLFKEIPKLLLENIISCLKLEIFFEGDVIINANIAGDAMYFIAFGTAAIYSTAGRRIGTLVDGSYFGEISLLVRGQKRTASIVALEMCEVYKLSQKDFRRVIEPHPQLLKRLEQMSLERIKQASKA